MSFFKRMSGIFCKAKRLAGIFGESAKTSFKGEKHTRAPTADT